MTSAGRSDGAWRALAAASTFAAIVLVAAWIADQRTGLPFGYFTRDPAAVTDSRVYVGFVSVVGLALWWTSAVVCGLAAWHANLRRAADRARPLAVMAAAIAYLALDDAFQLHEDVYLAIGVTDRVVQPVYVLATGLLIVAGRRFLATTCWELLALAGLWFACSVSIDLVDRDTPLVAAFEDGFKLLGIATLTVYCLQTAGREFVQSVTQPI